MDEGYPEGPGITEPLPEQSNSSLTWLQYSRK